MAVASRYWRVYFRSRVQYATSGLAFETLMPKDSSDANLLTGLTLTTTATLLNGTTYPLTALIDDVAGTYCAINYPSNTSTTWYQFNFVYASPVLIDRFLVKIYETSLGGTTVVLAALVDIVIDSSLDNVTWTRQSIQNGQIPLGGVDTRIAALVSSLYYPIPNAQDIGGVGGIYGIVSEDGVAQPNRPVVLFERESFSRVGLTTTNEYGGYAFNGLNLEREFAVMSYDPSGPPYKNALIWDRIKPINTKANLIPQNAFWAKRARNPYLGGVVSYSGYVNGPIYRFLRSNILGGCESIVFNGKTDLLNMDFYPDSAVGGGILFLKSARYRSVNPVNLGLALWVSDGCFNGLNQASNTSSYQFLTFEYIIKVPTPPEGSLVIVWSGTRDSDDATYATSANNYYSVPGGPTLEVTSTTLNVRFPLSAANLTTIRATAPVVAGGLYHVMVTYEQSVEIKLYMNGGLHQTTPIVGGGRIFSWSRYSSSSGLHYGIGADNWDYAGTDTGTAKLAALRRFNLCFLTGTGGNSGVGPAGWGGGVGLVAMYGETFNQAKVEDYYDSYVNWETHSVVTTQTGYMGQVEADNPMYYFRMNELSSVRGIVSILGRKDTYSTFEGAPGFNAVGFVGGASSITTSAGGVLLRTYSPIVQSRFTLEFFMRPTANTGSILFIPRIYNGGYSWYLGFANGLLTLNIYDHTVTLTTIVCPTVHSLNTAHHIGITYDPYDTKVCNFVSNGVLVYTVAATAVMDVLSNVSSWFGIGCNPSGTGPTVDSRFQGQLGEIAIYNYAVPVARLQEHYNARNS